MNNISDTLIPTVGVITDVTMAVPYFNDIALKLGITTEQLGMKIGLIVGSLFPLVATFLFLTLYKRNKKKVNVK